MACHVMNNYRHHSLAGVWTGGGCRRWTGLKRDGGKERGKEGNG